MNIHRILVSTILLLPAGAAWAQWAPGATADLGAGLGSMALGQATLEGTRSIDKTAKRDSPPTRSAKRSAAGAPVVLTFQRSPAVTAGVLQRMAEAAARKHPEYREQLWRDYTSGKAIRYFHERARGGGFSTTHLADITALYYLSVWEVIHGREATAPQREAVKRQFRAALLHDRSLAGRPDSEKQAIADYLAVHGALLLLGQEMLAAKGDAEMLANFRRGIVVEDDVPKGAQIAELMLTNEGFVER